MSANAVVPARINEDIKIEATAVLAAMGLILLSGLVILLADRV